MEYNELIIRELAKTGYSDRKLARKSGYSHTWLSLILNRKRPAGIKSALRILTHGFDYTKSEADSKLSAFTIEKEMKNLKGADIDRVKMKFGVEVGPNNKLIPIPKVHTLKDLDLKSQGIDFVYVPSEILKKGHEYRACLCTEIAYPPHIISGTEIVVDISSDYEAGEIQVFKVGEKFGIGHVNKSENHYEITASDRQLKIPINSPDFKIVGTIVRVHTSL